MNAASLSRFMNAADKSLTALFPATLVIDGESYAASGVGGSATHDFLDGGVGGGSAPGGIRYFRVSKSLLTERPAVGTMVLWRFATGGVTSFRIMEVPDRPHESSWMLQCEPANR